MISSPPESPKVVRRERIKDVPRSSSVPVEPRRRVSFPDLPGVEDLAASSTTESPKNPDSPASPQRRSFRESTRKSFFYQMGSVSSSATRMVIDNPRDLDEIYYIQRGNPISDDKVFITWKGVVKATGAERLVKAVKKMMMAPGRSDVAAEIDIMRELDHPNITLLREIFEDRVYVFLVFEFCNAGTLQARLNRGSRFSEVQAAITMQQVFRAVFYLHAKRICHRDLTPKNVLISATHPDEPICASTLFKVCGFACASMLDSEGRLSGQKGTPSHRAPEIGNNSYTNACDMWSCGVIMYQVLCGHLPFSTEDTSPSRTPPISPRRKSSKEKPKEHSRVSNGGRRNASPRGRAASPRAASPRGSSPRASHVVQSEQFKERSEGAHHLVSLLLERDVSKRYTAELALQHKWINKAEAKMAHVPLDACIFDNLRHFRSHSMFKRAALQIIATMLNQKETSLSRKIFHLADLNGDGMINVIELMEQIRKSPNLKVDIDIDELEGFFVDSTSQTGALKEFSYTEFLAATFDRKECLGDDVLWSAYCCFDRNGNEEISITELETGYLLHDIPQDDLRSCFEKIDTNKDDVICFEEFKAMMLDDERSVPENAAGA